MRIFIAFLLFFANLSTAQSDLLSPSAKRLPNESFQQALNRIYHLRSHNTPLNLRVPVEEIDYTSVPKVASYEELMELFYLIRDSRFLYSEYGTNFLRRISWLYPDDGCFLRAALGGYKAEKDSLVRPGKLFAFGKLYAQTQNSPEGYVRWWFHVALIVDLWGSYYILDPALYPYNPMNLEDWLTAINGKNSKLTGVICYPYTYSINDNCFERITFYEGILEERASEYLDLEYDRVIELGMIPEAVLGGSPPWMNRSQAN
ncbi:protein-glutamine glutaminase family protein [Legionella yabuuchiae]|uniref:protein-glutamine glutaminase family protein n=1 Tax=Legionella yabuuchiae TaxID=376727 RepID=UPI001055941F|nr:protein-glutamine glutaminase family protein [Legionella yabuuchiae]